MEELKGSYIGKRQEKRCFHSEIQKNKYAEGKKNHALPDAGSINMLQNSKEYKRNHCRSK